MFLFIIFLALFVGFYYVSTQNSLVSLDEKLKNSLSQIGIQQKTRWDAVTSLVKLTEKYSKHEHDSLLDIINARRNANIDTASDAKEQQEAFGNVLGKINALVESYPQLKASDLYANTMNQLTQLENNVRVSRQMYNDVATQLNSMIRQWPSSFIAEKLGFKTCEYLQFDESYSDMPNV